MNGVETNTSQVYYYREKGVGHAYPQDLECNRHYFARGQFYSTVGGLIHKASLVLRESVRFLAA